MPTIVRHGGNCCGISHIYRFVDYNPSKEQVTDVEREVKSWIRRNPSRLLEACLTESQMGFWAPTLQALGFKIVNRFVNSNSYNTVNVLHLVSSDKKRSLVFKVKPPTFKWEDK